MSREALGSGRPSGEAIEMWGESEGLSGGTKDQVGPACSGRDHGSMRTSQSFWSHTDLMAECGIR